MRRDTSRDRQPHELRGVFPLSGLPAGLERPEASARTPERELHAAGSRSGVASRPMISSIPHTRLARPASMAVAIRCDWPARQPSPKHDFLEIESLLQAL